MIEVERLLLAALNALIERANADGVLLGYEAESFEAIEAAVAVVRTNRQFLEITQHLIAEEA